MADNLQHTELDELFRELFKALAHLEMERESALYPERYINTAYGVHTHTCEGCGFEWTHDGQQTGQLSESEYEVVHTCTRCGDVQYDVTKPQEVSIDA